MWPSFDITDISKLGNQLGEVLQKARNEVERSVDSALGIDPATGNPLGQQQDTNVADGIPSPGDARSQVDLLVSGQTSLGDVVGTASHPDRVPGSKAGKKVVIRKTPGTTKRTADAQPLFATKLASTSMAVESQPINGRHATPVNDQRMAGAEAAGLLTHNRQDVQDDHLQNNEHQPNNLDALPNGQDKQPSLSPAAATASEDLCGEADQQTQLVHGAEPSSQLNMFDVPHPSESRSTPATPGDATPAVADVHVNTSQPDGIAESPPTQHDHGSSLPHSSSGRGLGSTHRDLHSTGPGADALQHPVHDSQARTRGDTAEQRAVYEWLSDPAHELHANGSSHDPVVELEARDRQLLQAAQQLSTLQQAVAQLQEEKEALSMKVLTAAADAQAEADALRVEFESRLAAAERKVAAMQKEREVLRSANRKVGEFEELLKEKDAIIQQVMGEGEVLSKKQVEVEGGMKRLRQQLKDAETEREKLAAALASEQAVSEELRRKHARLEREMAAAQQAAQEELAAQRAQHEKRLAEAVAAQTDAEGKLRDAAREGLQRSLREAEGRAAALTDAVTELKEALDRQRQAAQLREEMLQQDMSDLQRRCHAAEARHQELAAAMPGTTQPLLRQIEAMQAAHAAQGSAWAASERALQQRLHDAEERAAGSSEREAILSERLQMLQARLQAAEAALGAARGEVRTLSDAVDAARSRASEAEGAAAAARQQAAQATDALRALQRERAEMDRSAQEALRAEQDRQEALERDLAALREELRQRRAELDSPSPQHTPGASQRGFHVGRARLPSQEDGEAAGMSRDGSGAMPPALAGPGYRWVLVREGAEQAPDEEGGPGGGADPGSPLAAAAARAASTTGRPPAPALSRESSMTLSNPEVATLRFSMRQRNGDGGTTALEARVRELEVQRDRLADELLSATQRSDRADDLAMELATVRQQLQELQQQHAAAVELLGERDEQMEELRQDLMDVKSLYRDQIEFMAEQLVAASAPNTPRSAPWAADTHPDAPEHPA